MWRTAGERAPDHAITAEDPLVIDLDAILLDAHSEKECAATTFKKGFGFHPLLAFADHGAGGTGEPLAELLRAGNAGANSAADHKQVLAAALAQLPFQPGYRIGRKVLVRTDSGGGTHISRLLHRPASPVLARVRAHRHHRRRHRHDARTRVDTGIRRRRRSTSRCVGRRGHRDGRADRLACRYAVDRAQKGAHTPARSYGSPTSTGCG